MQCPICTKDFNPYKHKYAGEYMNKIKRLKKELEDV